MKRLVLITCLIISTVTLAFSQIAPLIKKNQPLEKTLTAGESHNYILALKKDQFVYGVLDQRGIDVMIKVYGPDGGIIETLDSPNGIRGPEPITIVTENAGKYKLEIVPFSDEAKPGKYRLEIKTIEKVASTPEGRIDQLMAPWNNQETPGASIAVVKDGKVVFKRGYGSANLEYRIPNTPSTIFHIASVSKQFTCFAIAMLADQGKLSLDDDIRKYIPEVPNFGETITIRHLVHHISGMRDQWNLLAMAGWRLDDVITKEQILKLVSHQKELNFKPGEEYLYCNTGFTLMAEIVARISEMSFADWCAQNIFQPLKMTNTLFYDDHQKIVPGRAYSYGNGREGEFQKSVLSYANVGATSLFTTVEDLSKWALNFEEMNVGDEELMDLMHTRGILNSGDTITYAFGQVITEYKGLKMVSHGGADAGYRTFLGRFPDQRFAVVVFSNLGSFNPGGIALQIADIYLEGDIQEEETSEETEGAVAETEVVTVDPDTYEDYAGKYELAPGFILTIRRDEDKLLGQATGQQEIELFPAAKDSFYLKVVEAQIVFRRNADSEVDELTLYQGGNVMNAPRMESFDEKSVDLYDYTGEYYSDELGTTYTIIVDDTALVATHRRHADLALTPLKEDVFSGNMWFFGNTKFVRDDNGHISGCKVSSGRVRDLYFVKTLDAIPERLSELFDKLEENGQFNGTVLISENGKVLHKVAKGYANFDTQELLKTRSPFYLASVSKQFTTMAIMILKEQGKLAFDDPLSKYFPAFPDYADKVTIRHLMTHTSGVPDHFNLDIYKPDLTNQDVLNALIKQESLEFQPGEKYQYSNGGYVLLSLIAEKVSGQPYHVYMRENIFEPLGMDRTLVFDESKPKMADRAVGYTNTGQLADYEILTTGAGGMFSNVEDMMKWDKALYENKLVKTTTLEEAYTSYVLNNGEKTGYGFGWSINDDPNGKVVSHSGSLSGYRTFIERDLENKRALILLTNTGNPHLQDIRRAVNAILNNNSYTLPKISIGSTIGKIIEKEGIEAAIDKYSKIKSAHPAEYDFKESELNNLGYQYMAKKDYKTALRIFKLNAEVFPDAFNTYDSLGEAYMESGDIEKAIKYYKKSIELNPGNDNGRQMLAKLGVKSESVSENIDIPDKVLESYVGKYELTPGFSITVTKKGTQMMAQATDQPKFEIYPSSENQFYLKVVAATLTFNHDENGIVESVTLNQNAQSLTGKKVE